METEQKAKRRREVIRRALGLLGIRNLLFGIQDPAFPSRRGEDIGRGTPYSDGAADLMQFVASLGFTGVQLGPQGITTLINPSPYDGTLFSRNPLSLSPAGLRKYSGLPTAAENVLKLPPEDSATVQLGHACRVMRDFIDALQSWTGPEWYSMFSNSRSFAEFRRENASWLERDALYEVLRRYYGGNNWHYWTGDDMAAVDRRLLAPPAGMENKAARRRCELSLRFGKELETYRFIQYLLHEQHRDFKERMNRLGLLIFGDLQIGFSGRDAWYAQSFLLTDYVMGAPPSRTNPQGQPWNYPVLDPGSYFRDPDRQQPGPALLFLRDRMSKLCSEYDGLRIDHPHGLVCPWVYRSGKEDPVRAVQEGARLFASPHLADHPGLAEFAIPCPGQLDCSRPRFDDNWVRCLEPEQVRRYGALFEVIMQVAGDNGRGVHEVACEILSTQPYPIKKVMERYGLGRFRITQKADLDNPDDVYRSENAAPEDWIMLGNHDTPSIRQVAEEWYASGKAEGQAFYLAGRLNIPPEKRSHWIRRTAGDPGELAQAKCADLFTGPARNVMIFFTDLFGLKEQYNLPGSTGPDNWSLRIAPDYRRRYAPRVSENKALNIPRALAAALRARGAALSAEHSGLLAELDQTAAETS